MGALAILFPLSVPSLCSLALPQQLPVKCSEALCGFWTKGETYGGPQSGQDGSPLSGSGQVHLGI